MAAHAPTPSDPASPVSAPDATADHARLQRLFRLHGHDAATAAQTLSREVVESFYRLALSHEDLAPRFEDVDVARLRDAQIRHWDALFASSRTGALAEVLANSVRVGRIHVDARVDTTTYMAGYAALTEDLMVGLMRSHLDEGQREAAVRAVLRCCFADMAASVAAYSSTASAESARDQLVAMSDSLEREMSNTLSEVGHQVQTLTQVAGQLETIAGDVTRATGGVGAAADSTREGVSVMAGAAQELESSSQAISEQTSGAADKAAAALAEAEGAKRAMQALTESAAAIGGVTELVQSIAKQTRLLALNATIEAARAGDAGKGFAVVAGEVKSLAAETEKAIASVHERTRQISESTESVNVALGGIVTGVEELAQRARAVASSADEQREAIARIARSAEEASVETGQVADQIASVGDTASVSLRAADRLSEISARLGRDVGDLQRRITIMLRSSAGDRRRAERIPVGLRGRLSVGGATVDGHTVDISATGALFFPGLDEEAAGSQGVIEIEGVGRVPVRVVGSSSLGSHLQFLRPGKTERQRVQAVIETTRRRDEPLIDTCRRAADRLAEILTHALAAGRIDEASLFDDDYVPIEGTDPVQYTTRFLELTDREFPRIQEAVLARDPGIVFCAAVDRNAYLPTHNRAYSKPQRPDDVVWNTANCRNRRIWDDRAGLLAARNTDEHRVQSYVRDMGGGNRQVLKEVDCPIRVADRIWGNLRLAYRA